jgi:replicative DNA helicase
VPARSSSRSRTATRSLEEQVLGAVIFAASSDTSVDGLPLAYRLLDRAAATGLTAEDFARPSHRVLWHLLCDMRDQGAPLDPAAVASELERVVEERVGELGTIVGGTVDRTALIGRLRALVVLAPPLCSIEWRAQRVIEAARRRVEA